MTGRVRRCLLEALVIAATAAGLGFGFNALRGERGIPWVARHPYAIFAPCPMARAEVEPVAPAAVPANGALFIDARQPAAWARSRIAGARNIPFDDLFDPPPEVIDSLLWVRAEMLVVYGDVDGERDSGRLLATDLAAAGIGRVRYLEGGLPAWIAAGRPEETGP